MNDLPKDSEPIASHARERLASLIAAKNEITASLDRVTAALDRLAGAQTCEAPIAAELARLDAAESAAMAAWARNGREGDDAPTPDVAARDDLNRKLADARAKAESARRAEGALVAERDRERAKLPRLDLAINEAIAEIIAEEAETLIPDFIESTKVIAAKAARIKMVADFIGDMARATAEPNLARPLYVILESFNTRIAETPTRAPQDDATTSKHRAEWASLIGRLQSNADARLES